MRLHHDRELFANLIEATAQDLKINPLYVEKDYWVTYILKNLAESSFSEVAIFKGGTSLSKAYKLIERFSEDIDLAVITKDLSANQVKSLLKKIEKSLLDENFTEVKTHPKSSKGSQFRKTLHQYPKIKTGSFGDADEHIMLEVNAFARPYPVCSREISSFIADFLVNRKPDLLITYELEPFSLKVLDHRRTFCEKLSAIARASFESDENYTTLKQKIRHLYDVYFLSRDPEVDALLKSDNFVQMLSEVREDDRSQFSEDWARVKLHETEIFSTPQKSLNAIKTYYESTFRELVFSQEFPSIEEIGQSLENIVQILHERGL